MLKMTVPVVYTHGIWWTTKQSPCCMGRVITKDIRWYCNMAGAAHAQAFPIPSWLESQCFHGWWCTGWNQCPKVSLTLSWYNQTCIFSKNATLKCIEYGRRITGCDVILFIWHVRRAWLKNVNRLATSSIKAKEMFSELGFIMKHTLNYEVEDAINQFFIKFAYEEKFLDYFNKNWVTGDKIRK